MNDQRVTLVRDGPITIEEALERFATAQGVPFNKALYQMLMTGFRVVDPAEYRYKPRRTRKVPLYIRKGGVRK